jgi:hypothetical protein
MTESTAETKEPSVEKVEAKEGFSVRRLVGGSTQREVFENLSYFVIFVSAVMVSIGVGAGSFVQGAIFIAVFGAFFVMVGIIVYIVSQFLGG